MRESRRPADGKGVRETMPRVRFILPAVAIVTALAPGAPAGAHSAGRALLYVARVHLEPHGDAWFIQTDLRDRDSGQSEPGFDVAASGRGPGVEFGPVRLADADNDGRYEATVPVKEGDWSITISARQLATGKQALPFERTWTVPVAPGRGFDIGIGGVRAGGGGVGVNFGLLAALMLVPIVVGALYLGRRRSIRHGSVD